MNRIDLEHLAEKIALSMCPGDNIFLVGDLGVGKSVFARAVLRTLGVTGNIPSPSFIVDAVYYAGNNEIHHIDLYRLEGALRELESFGIYDALDSDSLAVVEWADRLEGEILDSGVLVNIGFTDDPHMREVIVDDRRMAGIETTTSTGGVALVRDGKLVAEEYLSVIAAHSEKVLPCISDLLGKTEISSDEISGIAVSSGPGSYTGLRIGIATAIGLSAGWEKGLKGVETLRVLASSVTAERPVLACIRARQSEVYAALYESSSPDAGVLIPPGVYTVSALEKELSTGVELTAVGSGRSEISLPDSVLWAPALWDIPRPSLVALIGSIRAGAEGFDRVVTPVYLRGFNEKAKSSVR